MGNGLRPSGDSIRGWIAIFLVAIGGVAASMHSYYAGRASVLVIESQIKTVKTDIQTLENNTIHLLEEVSRLRTFHESKRHRRR